AHPWMDPEKDARLWPHEGAEIYAAFDGIFGCRTHGWTNLQSMHINLPFANDDEFGRLHAAIRLLLPILPALAASSPFLDGRFGGLLDGRIEAYRTNAQKIPAVSGRVIPEALFTAGDYREKILENLYREMEPFDAAGLLRYEWLNARGAIARFERNTIEIRILDMQECPLADLSIAWAILHVLKAITEERWRPLDRQQAWGVEPLREMLLAVARDAEEASITNKDYAAALGYGGPVPCSARDLWRHLLAAAVPPNEDYSPILDALVEHGCLARRVLAATGREPDRARLASVYRRLCDGLANNHPFRP
ncbi:MAG: glutamate-cysteine ligase family protein, partial [Verrucomicrobia bacterium]|nr:glutamate-cysteine ligase family protein [Verrucomicrobiota bacterium]